MINLDLLTEANFKTWLAIQPDSRCFVFCDTGHCLLACFLRESGVCKRPDAGTHMFSDMDTEKTASFPDWMRRLSTIVCDQLDNQFTARQARQAIEAGYSVHA